MNRMLFTVEIEGTRDHRGYFGGGTIFELHRESGVRDPRGIGIDFPSPRRRSSES